MARTSTTHLRLAGGLALLSLVIVACGGSRGGAAHTPVELAIAPIGHVPSTEVMTTGHASQGTCTLRLVATRIEKSAPGCYLDQHITDGPGLLHYPCSGEGPAEADFGDQHYSGRMTQGDLSLELTTELDWEDSCRWGTQATIRGTVVANGEPVMKRLTWHYADHVIHGSNCSCVCQAKSSFDVTSVQPKHGLHPAPKASEIEDDEVDGD